MSTAEMTAHRLYESMGLDRVSDDVKRHLMILILSKQKPATVNAGDESIQVPTSYEEAIQMGAMDVEKAREELHTYVDELGEKYELK